LVRDFIEREFNYSIFSYNTDCRSNHMLVTRVRKSRHNIAVSNIER
jgi:hypothetical protein